MRVEAGIVGAITSQELLPRQSCDKCVLGRPGQGLPGIAPSKATGKRGGIVPAMLTIINFAHCAPAYSSIECSLVLPSPNQNQHNLP